MVKSGDWVSQGWDTVKPYLGTYILIALVAGLLSAVTVGILAGPLVCGWFMIVLRQRRDPAYEPQFGDLWKGFEVFGQSFLAWLTIAILAGIAGGIVSVIASIIAAVPVVGQILAPMTGAVIAVAMMVVFLYTFPLIADRRMDFIPAIQLSAETTAAQFGPYAGFAFILYLLNAIGSALCLVGSLVTNPIVMASVAAAYLDSLADIPEPDAARSPEPMAPDALDAAEASYDGTPVDDTTAPGTQ